MKSFIAALLLAWGGMLLMAGAGLGSDDASPLLDRLVTEALANNPEIRASQARWDAFVQRARRAGSLEDPMLMLRMQNMLVRDPLTFDGDNMTAKVIGISQQLPFYGKRALERKAAGFEAEAARWTLQERQIELQRMVKETWYQIYFVDRSLEVLDRNITTLDDLSRTTETLYGTGKGLQQDVLKVQVERSRMEDMRISLQQQRRSLEATLNALLYRPAATPVPVVPQVAITPLDISAEALEQLAEEHRPQLRTLAAQQEKARVVGRLASREFYPDFNVSFEYMQRDPAMGGEGFDMYSAGISLNLPVQRARIHAKVAEAESETRMAVEEMNMLRNEIRRDIADTLARLDRSRKLAELYQGGILPQAYQSFNAALAAYRVGSAEFLNVLDSQMALFNFEREYYDAVAEHQMRLAQLEGVVGTTLPPAAP